MLNTIIGFSLRNRGLVLIAAISLFVFGTFQLPLLPVDVFPDLNRPTVTIMTEAPGLAPEEIESLVTRPLEYRLNGATGVRRVRSASAVGLSIVWVEFDWGTDIFLDRQIVAEKLQAIRGSLPEKANPVITPISSIMGEIMLIGIRPQEPSASTGENHTEMMNLRTFAEFDLRNRLMAIEGISQVTVMGGFLKQMQIITSPTRLAAQQITLEQLTSAAQKANIIAGGGLISGPQRESLIRIQGQSLYPEQIENAPVIFRGNRAVQIKEVADVIYGGPIPRGSGGSRTKSDNQVIGGEAIILAIQKQPSQDTLLLDSRIDNALDEIEKTLPTGVVIDRNLFRQSSFIRAAIDNVLEALRDGAIWVVLVLFLFMWNFRTSISSLTAMPLSIVLTFVIFRLCGVTINTMTLGGIAVAIGDLVDDSIVDIENIYRRLKENRQLPEDQQRDAIDVIYDASCEVRNSIVYATMIVVLVVVPLFGLGGLEGRFFAPLGFAYMTSLVASLAISLTLTPVLASYLLPKAKFLENKKPPFVLRSLQAVVRKILNLTLNHTTTIFVSTLLCTTISLITLFWMGGEFLPPFNEGTVTVSLQTEPGTSLEESRRVAMRVENSLLDIPEVQAVSRRTGRAELDEHAEGVHSSEIDVILIPHRIPKQSRLASLIRLIPIAHLWGYSSQGRPFQDVIQEIRDRLTIIPGIKINIGQPISHRLDHIMSGIRAQIAIKIFGDDLSILRQTGDSVIQHIEPIAGIVDLQQESQVEIPQLRIEIRREAAARHGLSPGDIAMLLETAYRGKTVSQIYDREKTFDLVVWYDEQSRNDPQVIQRTILETPSGRRVSLGEVANVIETTGPNTINREGVRRRLVVFCNVEGRDLSSVVGDIQRALKPIQSQLDTIPGGYYLQLGGQFEAQQQASLRLAILGTLSVVAICFLLVRCLESWNAALQVLVNIPLAAMGSIGALLIVNRPSMEILSQYEWYLWPKIWIESTTLSIAHWVGFITLIGIVSRNGIMMLSHYIHLMRFEGESFGKEMIIRGSLERVAPVMMTAITSFVGLLPLITGAGETGKEILHPLAIVVLGGMLSSTLLDQIVTPALFLRFGKPVEKSSHCVTISPLNTAKTSTVSDAASQYPIAVDDRR